ncbi:MAG: MBL fold metallo-hydrolase [Candidatus Thorarchaeota archaeon]|nr:MAG: MBL fold metallo-hydrolase [Candidatus Thorarchaeota archaeon]
MPIDKKKIPQSKIKIIGDFISWAAECAESVANGNRPEIGKGLFGESGELIVYEILRHFEVDASSLSYALEVDERLAEVFRDILARISTEDYLDCATLCMYGFIIGNYTDEDFRYVYRYSLGRLKDRKLVEDWLRKALVFLAACKYESEREILAEVRELIRYLGAPLPNPRTYLETCNELGIDIEQMLVQEDYRLVDTIRRHTKYLEEATGSKTYLEIWTQSSEWLPDALSSRILRMYRERAYREVQSEIPETTPAKQAFDLVKKHFKEIGFQSDKDAVLPIRLQELPTSPPPEAIDPSVFEMIPQKLRINLLPSMAYYTATKRIEIIFLGGPRIGRSSVLIKTDTGGILLDYGLSVANQKIPEWAPELEMIDTVIVSHAHLDHVGGLPVLYDTYSGKWCSTGMTGAITKVLLDDAISIGTPAPPRSRDRTDLISRLNQSNVDKVTKNHVKLEIGKSSEVGPGIVVTPIDACHIPGSTSLLIDIEGKKILYTGDFNIDSSVLFQGASLPTDIDVVMFDGTYWAREDFDRAQVTRTIQDVIENHGPVVIPSFAVGRSQEILMILEGLGITRTRNVMVAGMAERVTKLAGINGRWSGMKKNKVVLEKDDVLVAGGGMMGGGLARHHFKEHQNDPRAAVILCGYLAPRTPGWNLHNGYEPHSCRVQYARLSAHSSASNLERYIKSCKGKRVMLHTPHEGRPRGVTIPERASKLVLNV